MPDPADGPRRHRRLVPLLLGHRRRHGARRAGRRRRRPRPGAAPARPPAGRRLGARGRAGPARRHRRHQDPRARSSRRAWCAPRPTSPAWSTEARLPDRVQRRALATFDALAEAEGRLHRRPPESVHFHEVGGIDAIIDVVGTCAALEVLGVDEIDAERGGQRHRHGARRPRPAPRPRPGGGRAAARAPPPTSSTCPSSSPRRPAPRCSPPTSPTWGPMPPMTIERRRLRRRLGRSR